MCCQSREPLRCVERREETWHIKEGSHEAGGVAEHETRKVAGGRSFWAWQATVGTLNFFLKINLCILFIYFWLRWVFVAVCRLSLVAASGGYSSLWCAGFSLRWLLLLRSMGSRHVGFSSCGLRALESRLSSCGAWALLLRGMWDLPGPGLEPVSPA